MAVAELPITKSMPSVSHKKEFSLWSYDVADTLTYRVVIGMHIAGRSIPCCTNIFIFSLAKVEAKMNLDQGRMNPLTNGYK